MKKKLALITGGSSGLGYAMAEYLGSQGFALVLLARDEKKLRASETKLKEKGYDVQIFSADICNEEQLAAVKEGLLQQTKQIDFLILNAGVVEPGLLCDRSTKSLKAELDTNLWGTILATRTFHSFLAKGSTLLIISSGYGLMGPAGYSAYSASKGGLILFAEAYFREVKHRGVKVSVACPSDIDTPQFQYEQSVMPDWMRSKSSPKAKAHPPALIARRIITACRKNKFLITSSWDVRALILMTKILPRKWRDIILDSAFPRPLH